MGVAAAVAADGVAADGVAVVAVAVVAPVLLHQYLQCPEPVRQNFLYCLPSLACLARMNYVGQLVAVCDVFFDSVVSFVGVAVAVAVVVVLVLSSVVRVDIDSLVRGDDRSVVR